VEYPGKKRQVLLPLGFLRPGEAHCRSLGYARDDKGRTITNL
jgi:hypothetical protein